MGEKFCPLHGPYPDYLSSCPYCEGESIPAKPKPLGDDAPTNISPGRPVGYDDEPTDLGFGGGEKTEIGIGFEMEEPTQLGAQRVEDVTEIDQEPIGLLGILWAKSGHRRGSIFQIQEGTVVGRNQGELILDDPKVSSLHAKFTVEDDQFYLWDFGSKNGTFVNGKRIREATPLRENDEIKIGDSVFVLKILNDEEEELAPRPRRKPPARKK